MEKEVKYCEHEGCKAKATWMVRSHSFGMVAFGHCYCDGHFNLHIAGYKLEPGKDIVRLPKRYKMKGPTQGQIKEFWEKLGYKVKYNNQFNCNCVFFTSDDGDVSSTRVISVGSSINLNNLFKYAAPKVLEKIGKLKLVALVSNALCDAIEAGEKLDYFLFWAFHKVIK